MISVYIGPCSFKVTVKTQEMVTCRLRCGSEGADIGRPSLSTEVPGTPGVPDTFISPTHRPYEKPLVCRVFRTGSEP